MKESIIIISRSIWVFQLEHDAGDYLYYAVVLAQFSGMCFNTS
jgi:hypothetical protein